MNYTSSLTSAIALVIIFVVTLENVCSTPFIQQRNYNRFNPFNQLQYYQEADDDINSFEGARTLFYNKYPQIPGQSPVNLRPFYSVPVMLPPLRLNSYDRAISSMKLINTGETVMVSLPTNYPGDQTPFVSGSAFNTNYRFVQLHFHWGSNSINGGSEHLIGSRRYAAEMHLVHYNTKYNSLAEAVRFPDGLAVIGVMLDTTNNPNDNAGFEKIVSQLSSINVDGSETTLNTPLKLNDLMPQNTNLFYRYQGSLTTPNYDEIVTWTVFKRPLFVSERQVQALRNTHKGGTSNYHEIQSLNNRRVFFNWWRPIFPNFLY